MRASWVIIGVLVLALAGGAYYVATNPSIMDQFKQKKVITDQKVIQKTVVGFAADPYADDYNTVHVSGYVDNLGASRSSRPSSSRSTFSTRRATARSR